MMPNYGAHASRVPVHTLEGGSTRNALLSDEDSFYRPPTSRAAGVTRGVDSGREYTLANAAFQPAGFRSPVRREVVPDKSVEYRSFRMLKQDKTKHVRATHAPMARAAAPTLSSDRNRPYLREGSAGAGGQGCQPKELQRRCQSG